MFTNFTTPSYCYCTGTYFNFATTAQWYGTGTSHSSEGYVTLNPSGQPQPTATGALYPVQYVDYRTTGARINVSTSISGLSHTNSMGIFAYV